MLYVTNRVSRPKLICLAVVVGLAVITACYETEPFPAAPTAEPTSSLAKVARPAASRGLATLTLRELNSQSSLVEASIGDTLTVEVFVESSVEQITGVVIFLSIDDAVLELVPVSNGGRGPVPFTRGEYINGTVFNNDTIDDRFGEPLANTLPLFQLRYFENIPPAVFGEPTPAMGDGVLARFRVRVRSANPTSIQLDEVSKVGSEMGYFVLGKPGENKAFRRLETLTVTPSPIERRVVEPMDEPGISWDVTLLLKGAPVPGAEVAVARSISGVRTSFDLRDETNLDGRVLLHSDNAEAGYYVIRAKASDGEIIGRWNSIPSNPGHRYRLTFDVGR